jgi:hypothetical protein
MIRAWVGVGLVAVILGGGPGVVAAQETGGPEAARELARLMMDSDARRAIDEQVRVGMMRSLTTTLQERLNRRLLDVEVNLLADIVRRFLTEALPPSRTEEIAARIYRRYFDDAELRELLALQRSAIARKAARLGPAIALETAQAIDRELQTSPALPDTLAALQHAFPVLGRPESP